jgi:hypothetical protein
MSNVHGLFSNRKDDDESSDDENDRFVGGIGDRGGGRYEYNTKRSLMCWTNDEELSSLTHQMYYSASWIRRNNVGLETYRM